MYNFAKHYQIILWEEKNSQHFKTGNKGIIVVSGFIRTGAFWLQTPMITQ